jgi:hypothetical protein
LGDSSRLIRQLANLPQVSIPQRHSREHAQRVDLAVPIVLAARRVQRLLAQLARPSAIARTKRLQRVFQNTHGAKLTNRAHHRQQQCRFSIKEQGALAQPEQAPAAALVA